MRYGAVWDWSRLLLVCITVPFAVNCVRSYEPESATWSESAVRMGCLDVTVEEPRQAEVEHTLLYRFGNRCRGDVRVDLSAVRVEGITSSGEALPMELYDPRSEVRSKTLRGLGMGEELLSYVAPSDVALVELCADLSGVGDAPVEGELGSRICVPTTTFDGPSEETLPIAGGAGEGRWL